MRWAIHVNVDVLWCCYSLLVGKRRPVPECGTFKILCWSNDTNRSAGAQSLEDGVCPHIVGWQLLLAAVTPSQLLPLPV